MNIFQKLFGKKTARQSRQLIVSQFSDLQFSLEEWRKHPKLVEDARKLFENPTWKLIEQVMRNESPVNQVPVNEGQNANKDLQTLGDIRGYHRALNILEAFSKPLEDAEPVESTFETEKTQ